MQMNQNIDRQIFLAVIMPARKKFEERQGLDQVRWPQNAS